MDTTKLNIAFSGTKQAELDAVLKSAEIIIPYFQFQENKAGGNADASGYAISCSMHAQGVVSFAGMLQELINQSGGSALLTDDQGESVKLTKGKPDFHFGELEKLLQPVL